LKNKGTLRWLGGNGNQYGGSSRNGNRTAYDPALLLLGIHQKQSKLDMFFMAVFTIAKIWNQTRCPSIDERTKKMWRAHTHTHTYTDGIYIQPLKRVKSCHFQEKGWN
jgi:hypothetical protein